MEKNLEKGKFSFHFFLKSYPFFVYSILFLGIMQLYMVFLR